MTLEQAQAELDSLKPQERELWDAIQSLKDKQSAATDKWQPVYHRVRELETFIKLSTLEPK